MQTGQRGVQRPAPGNATGQTFYRQQREQAAKQKAEAVAKRAEEQQATYRTPDELVADVQATLKSGIAFWNPDAAAVEVDYSGSYC